MIRVTVIKTDGECSESDSDKSPTLDDLQKTVGGYIESISHIIKRFNGMHVTEAYCDEDALLKPVKIMNTKASVLAGQPLFGNVVIIQIVRRS